ncbi:MAG: GNAT family N-acetyltransferase [Candidatus Latescibacteria bacterium]|nr:GNAT family N-acetyltransferase [Candidatus Latescibacterota bacterium]
MPFDIRPYTPNDLPGVHNLYNELTTDRVPHCWPVAASVLGTSLAEKDIERDWARLLEQVVLVAAEGAKISGFIHLGRQAANKWQDEHGVIRFLAYRRGQRPVGDALLAAAESWMREHKLPRSVVLPQPWGYSFYGFPHTYLSDHLDHVQALLRYRGYSKSGGEVFLDWLDMQPEALPDTSGLEYELKLEERLGAGPLPGLQVKALQGNEEIGNCLLDSGAESSAAPQAAEFAFCNELNVQEKFQGKGLGRFLLAHAMCQARQRGYRHGAISTAHNNDRAFLFYANYGFRVADWTYQFTKKFS